MITTAASVEMRTASLILVKGSLPPFAIFFLVGEPTACDRSSFVRPTFKERFSATNSHH